MEDPDKLIENGCVICREFHTEKQFTVDLAKTFSKNINSFHGKDLLDDDLSRLLKNGKDILATKLKSGSKLTKKRKRNVKSHKIQSSINTGSQCSTNQNFVELCMYCKKVGHEGRRHPIRSRVLYTAAGKNSCGNSFSQNTSDNASVSNILKPTPRASQKEFFQN